MYVHSELVCEMRAVEHCSCFHSWLSSIGSCIAAIMVNQWYNNSRACNMYVWAEVNVTNRLDSYTIACEIHRSSVFATRQDTDFERCNVRRPRRPFYIDLATLYVCLMYSLSHFFLLQQNSILRDDHLFSPHRYCISKAVFISIFRLSLLFLFSLSFPLSLCLFATITYIEPRKFQSVDLGSRAPAFSLPLKKLLKCN